MMGTKRHQTTNAVYQFLWDYVHEHGFPPTQQEIATHCFLTQPSVSRHLDKLEKWGWLAREEGKARGIKLLLDPSLREKSYKIIR
jgi:DNA-binding MarR family transcriptional regulator